MERQVYHQQLSEVNAAFAGQDYEIALRIVQELKQALLCSPTSDHSILGWVRFYEFKSLYKLRRYQDAYELLWSPESKLYTISAKNSGYMYSVGVELAMRLERPDDVLLWGQRCLATRLSYGDFVSALQCAITVCELLHVMDCDERNLDFVHYLLALGVDYESEQAVLDGYRYMLHHIDKSPDPATIYEARAGISLLQAFQSDEWSGEASELIEAIVQSSWYESSLPAPVRRDKHRMHVIHKAAATGDVRQVEWLLRDGVSADVRDECLRTPLMQAAFAGHPEVVALLLRQGVQVNAQNMQRRTPLILAARRGHTDVLKQLIEAGAALEIPGLHGQTALHVACRKGHLQATRLLLEAGADIEARDAANNTALLVTAAEDQPDIVRCLLGFDANIEALGTHNQTALMRASIHGQAYVAQILVWANADVHCTDSYHMTAADWATHKGYPHLAQWLQGELSSSPANKQPFAIEMLDKHTV